MWNIDIKINEKLFIRNPNDTELGRKIVKHGIVMIEEMGLEEFTFKKLALEIGTTEASIYRYFENKFLLLTYAANWYWSWLEYLVVFKTNNVTDPTIKIDYILDVLLLNTTDSMEEMPALDKRVLHMLVMKESSKTYFTNQVKKFNDAQFFKPYKSLCERIADILREINPNYQYPKNLTSTVLTMSSNLYFFMHNLPSMTDEPEAKDVTRIKDFLKELILKTRN